MRILTIRQMTLLFVCAFWDCVALLVSGTILVVFAILPLTIAVAVIVAMMTEDWIRRYQLVLFARPQH